MSTLQYSPLCDSSYEAYSEYLSAVKLREFRTLVGDGVCDKLFGDGARKLLSLAQCFGVSDVGGRSSGRVVDFGVADGVGAVAIVDGRSTRESVDGYRGVAVGAVGLAGTYGEKREVGVAQRGDDESGCGGVKGGVSPGDVAEVAGVVGTGTADGHVDVSVRAELGEIDEHGKHWKKNRAKREKAKAMKRSWRGVDASGGCVSDESVVSVHTVDTRTAVEIEAVQTLAARRVVENQLAIAKGRAQLRGFCDSAKTDAVNRLAAARMEQRINEAKAKSQASFKKCDESFRSLGSTGSAGEFAMRIEIQKAKESERMLKYVQEQADYLAKHASPEVLQHVHGMPLPEPVDAYEIFGDCSSDLSPHEAAAYYDELNRFNEESMLRFGRY